MLVQYFFVLPLSLKCRIFKITEHDRGKVHVAHRTGRCLAYSNWKYDPVHSKFAQESPLPNGKATSDSSEIGWRGAASSIAESVGDVGELEDQALAAERREMLEDQFRDFISGKYRRLDRDFDLLAAAMALNPQLSFLQTRQPLHAAIAAPWFIWVVGVIFLLLAARLIVVVIQFLQNQSEVYFDCRLSTENTSMQICVVRNHDIDIIQTSTSHFPWQVQILGETVGLLTGLAGLLVFWSGNRSVGRCVSVFGCGIGCASWITASWSFAKLTHVTMVYAAGIRAAGFALLLVPVTRIGHSCCETSTWNVPLDSLAGLALLGGSISHWIAVVHSPVKSTVSEMIRDPRYSWLHNPISDASLWLGVAISAVAAFSWAKCRWPQNFFASELPFHGCRKNITKRKADAGITLCTCTQARREAISNAHELVMQISSKLSGAVNQRRRRSSTSDSADSSRDTACERSLVNHEQQTSASWTELPARCLDQLLVQAAGIDPFLRDRVRRWAIQTGGCFPLTQRNQTSPGKEINCDLDDLGGSRHIGKRVDWVMRRWEEIAADRRLRGQVCWRRPKGIEQATAELSCAAGQGAGDPSLIVDYCRQASLKV